MANATGIHAIKPVLRIWLLRALFAVVLLGTFAAYLRPDFAFDLANRIMLCF